jgi:hypothetical protein
MKNEFTKLIELVLRFLFLLDKYEFLYLVRMQTEGKYLAQKNMKRL